MKLSAQVITDSISDSGHRLTTLEITFHRFILAELNTHREFSRNSASSRAIPINKVMEAMSIDLALPLHFGASQSGMQADEEIPMSRIIKCTQVIRDLSVVSRKSVKDLSDHGLHKQVANRYLEPWLWHTAIVTSSNFSNFFAQRRTKFAQPEMKALADAMYDAYRISQPKKLSLSDWHLPYITQKDLDDVHNSISDYSAAVDVLKMVSVARCARVSYLTHDGIRDISKDVELYGKLLSSGHWSPFEHVAKPCVHLSTIKELESHKDNVCIDVRCSMWGNFKGWDQYRKHFNAEYVDKYKENIE